tara:strand:- start:149 stop:871 length:723 start_codon:yes stop_codon:yes gene_type:complete
MSEETVYIYVGTDGGANSKAEKALEYSIKKYCSVPYVIEWMDTARGAENWQGWNKKDWYTKFSHFRFAIPEVHGFKGRAIYLDVDQIFLKDPKDLFNIEIPEGKVWTSLDTKRTDVIVYECERFKSLPHWPSLEEMKKNENGEHIGHFSGRLSKYWHPLPHKWCCNDGGIASDQKNKFVCEPYDREKTCLLHYTQMDWQPWKPYPKEFSYPPHPHPRAESIWWQMYAGALEEELKNGNAL